jgi:hypothetical protein
LLDRASERFERRLAEETGKIRLDIAGVREEMGTLRFDLLKWSFLFWIGELAAMAGILSLMLPDR